MVKIVTVFLIAMMVLAIFGRLRLPFRRRGGRDRVETARKCPRCGRYRIGGGRCDCARLEDD